MVLQRWYPLASRRIGHDPFDRLWKGFFTPAGPTTGSFDRMAPLDVRETDEEIVVTASLPGVAPEDIEVTIEDRVLSISAESAAENENARREATWSESAGPAPTAARSGSRGPWTPRRSCPATSTAC